MITERVDGTLLDAAPALRVVSQMAVGVDNIDLGECARRDIRVGHTPGVLTETVADTALALLGAVVRRLPEGEKAVRDGEWGPWAPFWMTGSDLWGTTIGIVGMGRIGQAVANRAIGYGMNILYHSRQPKPYVPGRSVTFEQLLRESDHVVISVELNAGTVGMFGKREFELMKPTAFLVNVSRGPTVVTSDLVEALRTGQIAGAGLDVTDPEPLPSTHELLDLPNCLVVPHIGSASVRTRRAMAKLAVDNLLVGLEGGAMPAEIRSSDGT